MRRIFLPIAILLAHAFGCSAPPPVTHVSASYKEYTSVDELAADADAIVQGRIERRVANFDASEGNGQREPGITMVAYDLVILAKSRNTATPDIVSLVHPDMTKAIFEDVVDVKVGQTYVLFLKSSKWGSRPSFTPRSGVVYSVLGAMAGAFEVNNSGVRVVNSSVQGKFDAPGLLRLSPGHALSNAAPK